MSWSAISTCFLSASRDDDYTTSLDSLLTQAHHPSWLKYHSNFQSNRKRSCWDFQLRSSDQGIVCYSRNSIETLQKKSVETFFIFYFTLPEKLLYDKTRQKVIARAYSATAVKPRTPHITFQLTCQFGWGSQNEALKMRALKVGYISHNVSGQCHGSSFNSLHSL